MTSDFDLNFGSFLTFWGYNGLFLIFKVSMLLLQKIVCPPPRKRSMRKMVSKTILLITKGFFLKLTADVLWLTSCSVLLYLKRIMLWTIWKESTLQTNRHGTNCKYRHYCWSQFLQQTSLQGSTLCWDFVNTLMWSQSVVTMWSVLTMWSQSGGTTHRPTHLQCLQLLFQLGNSPPLTSWCWSHQREILFAL